MAAAASGRPPRRGSWLTLAASIGAPLALGQVMGIWSLPDVAEWYPKLDKPSWTPPVWMFGPIWATLYTAMGYAAHRVWQAGAGQSVLGLYAVQLALNLAWQPLFFKSHDLRTAAIDITALLAVLVPTVRQFYKYDVLAGRLMVPYILFSCFAAALTYRIRSLNGPHVE